MSTITQENINISEKKEHWAKSLNGLVLTLDSGIIPIDGMQYLSMLLMKVMTRRTFAVYLHLPEADDGPMVLVNADDLPRAESSTLAAWGDDLDIFDSLADVMGIAPAGRFLQDNDRTEGLVDELIGAIKKNPPMFDAKITTAAAAHRHDLLEFSAVFGQVRPLTTQLAAAILRNDAMKLPELVATMHGFRKTFPNPSINN